jgi:CDGSH-type Zn-finger protein
MTTPSSKGPFLVDLKEGESYYWCSCGLSSKVPFCDGTHKGSGKKSLPFIAPKDESRHLCTCLNTKNPPYCDGSHSQ